MQLNRFEVAGLAGRNAESCTTARGAQVVRFPLCHTQPNGSGGFTSTWIRVNVFADGWRDVAVGVRKGDNVYCEGRIELTTARDAAGAERVYVDLIVQRIAILKPDGHGRSYSPPALTGEKLPEDLPF